MHDPDSVEELLASGTDPNESDGETTPLLSAALGAASERSNQNEADARRIIAALLAAGAVNLGDRDGLESAVDWHPWLEEMLEGL